MRQDSPRPRGNFEESTYAPVIGGRHFVCLAVAVIDVFAVWQTPSLHASTEKEVATLMNSNDYRVCE